MAAHEIDVRGKDKMRKPGATGKTKSFVIGTVSSQIRAVWPVGYVLPA